MCQRHIKKSIFFPCYIENYENEYKNNLQYNEISSRLQNYSNNRTINV